MIGLIKAASSTPLIAGFRGSQALSGSRVHRRVSIACLAMAVSLLLTLSLVPTAFADERTHRVQPGDTVYDIAFFYGVDADDLMKLNNLVDPTRLQIGQTLRIPASSSRSPRQVYTWTDIAQLYGVPVWSLSGKNRLADQSQIASRQDLLVPAQLSDRYSTSARGERPTPPVAPSFIWPCYGRITAYFGEPGSYWVGGYHFGLDLAGREGEAVVAAADALVLESEWHQGYGLYVKLLHSGDYVTLYAHLSASFVEPGDMVNSGQTIGAIGSTGVSTGPHLHFEIRYQGVRVDPLLYLP